MNPPVIRNGKLVDDDGQLINRGFLYGDGLFETIRIDHFKPLFFNYHFERLTIGCRMLALDIPFYFSKEYLRDQIISLVSKADFPSARVRLTLWRSSKGGYLPERNYTEWRISVSPLENENFTLGRGLTAGIYRDNVKPLGPLSTIKSLNALLYVQAARYASENSWDDAILINSEQRILEGTASALLIRQGDHWMTPPLTEGCVESVMKRVITGLLSVNGLLVKEIPVTEKILLGSDEILLVNVIRGVMQVKKIGNNEFNEDSGVILTEWLNELIREKES